ALPYLFQRDVKGPDGRAAWPQFRRVLIIGAGSGNDVARALQWLPPDAHIDAVEIDPVLYRIGHANHPDDPYDTDRVSVHLTDGRNFLRSAEAGTYDLVIFALVDSLVLHSGHANLRLESYLFTRESFRDVARVLRPDGLCVVYNFFRHGWLVARLRDGLRDAFECDPVVIVTPSPEEAGKQPLREVRRDTFEPNGFTAFFAGRSGVIAPLRAAFADGVGYWFPWRTAVPPDTAARFSADPPPNPPPPPPPGTAPKPFRHRDAAPLPPVWLRLQPASVEESGDDLPPATDDWPFLYVRSPEIPALTWRGIGLVLGLSVVLWWGLRPRGAGESGTPDRGLVARSFFLGAGFMLVETKSVVQMALLFGGTWVVNTVVFAAILVMSLAGTLIAGWAKPRRLGAFYVGLFATLALGLALPMDTFLGCEQTTQAVLASALTFAPIAFAGVIFAVNFDRSSQPDRVFGANVAGALVGGLAENVSVVLGFQYLLCVAVGFYLLSMACGNRTLPDVTAEKSV
ncbi:MAG TPA: hypothetical protein VKE74_26110, partial [Gemmataceae bacterium]|nr:hypothetical protein [Gemmataceae bacterium]